MIDTTEAAYRLTYQPDGTSITVRENLVDIMDNLRDRREREVTKAGRTIASAIAVISSRLHRACPGATTANDRASAASLRRLS